MILCTSKNIWHKSKQIVVYTEKIIFPFITRHPACHVKKKYMENDAHIWWCLIVFCSAHTISKWNICYHKSASLYHFYEMIGHDMPWYGHNGFIVSVNWTSKSYKVTSFILWLENDSIPLDIFFVFAFISQLLPYILMLYWYMTKKWRQSKYKRYFCMIGHLMAENYQRLFW